VRRRRGKKGGKGVCLTRGKEEDIEKRRSNKKHYVRRRRGREGRRKRIEGRKRVVLRLRWEAKRM
jgi:hypothetical protein